MRALAVSGLLLLAAGAFGYRPTSMSVQQRQRQQRQVATGNRRWVSTEWWWQWIVVKERGKPKGSRPFGNQRSLNHPERPSIPNPIHTPRRDALLKGGFGAAVLGLAVGGVMASPMRPAQAFPFGGGDDVAEGLDDIAKARARVEEGEL
jgi:hypothetical protein